MHAWLSVEGFLETALAALYSSEEEHCVITRVARIKAVSSGFTWKTPSRHQPESNYRQQLQQSVTPIAHAHSHGILTVCPSGAALAIPLGPTNPELITMALETLVFRCAGISPALWLLVPAFSLRITPAWVTPLPSSQIRTLSYRLYASLERQDTLSYLVMFEERLDLTKHPKDQPPINMGSMRSHSMHVLMAMARMHGRYG